MRGNDHHCRVCLGHDTLEVVRVRQHGIEHNRAFRVTEDKVAQGRNLVEQFTETIVECKVHFLAERIKTFLGIECRPGIDRERLCHLVIAFLLFLGGLVLLGLFSGSLLVGSLLFGLGFLQAFHREILDVFIISALVEREVLAGLLRFGLFQARLEVIELLLERILQVLDFGLVLLFLLRELTLERMFRLLFLGQSGQVRLGLCFLCRFVFRFYIGLILWLVFRRCVNRLLIGFFFRLCFNHLCFLRLSFNLGFLGGISGLAVIALELFCELFHKGHKVSPIVFQLFVQRCRMRQ